MIDPRLIATRVSPPCSTHVSRPVTANGRRSTWHGATPSDVSVGETERFTIGWLM